MNKQKLKFDILDTIFAIFYTILLFFLTYIMQSDNIIEAINAQKQIVAVDGIKYIVVSYLIIFSLFIIIKSIVRDNLKTNIILTIITLIITIISYYKFKILELPFLPSDILLIGNAHQIAEFGLTSPNIGMIFIIILLVLLLVLNYIIRKQYYKKTKVTLKTDWYRIPLFFIGIFIIYSVCIKPNRFTKLKLINELGNNYAWMGGNAVFFMHLGDFYNEKPEDYTEEKMQEIKEEVEENNKKETSNISQKANVIIIMNESFTNPNKIKNVEYSINPLQDIEKLSVEDKNCYFANTITPVMGGGTSLPEFEALTGLTSYYIEKQVFPYTSNIKSNMNSIVRCYKNADYETIGIHTYTKNFYNRKSIYKYLGFDKTIFSEDIENPQIKGKYISDDEFANQIINIFETSKENKFVFGVTMQNHMPYGDERYETYDIQVKNSNLSEKGEKELRDYVQGVYDGNKMYIKLVEYLKDYEEPTILVMFGDHLPALKQSKIYEDSSYSLLDYYSTPYIVWSNYDMQAEKLLFEYMSPSNLSLKTLKLAGIKTPWYLEKFEELYEKYPAINNQFAISKNYEFMSANNIRKEEILNTCKILQYDLLIKKRYINIK